MRHARGGTPSLQPSIVVRRPPHRGANGAPYIAWPISLCPQLRQALQVTGMAGARRVNHRFLAPACCQVDGLQTDAAYLRRRERGSGSVRQGLRRCGAALLSRAVCRGAGSLGGRSALHFRGRGKRAAAMARMRR